MELWGSLAIVTTMTPTRRLTHFISSIFYFLQPAGTFVTTPTKRCRRRQSSLIHRGPLKPPAPHCREAGSLFLTSRDALEQSGAAYRTCLADGTRLIYDTSSPFRPLARHCTVVVATLVREPELRRFNSGEFIKPGNLTARCHYYSVTP